MSFSSLPSPPICNDSTLKSFRRKSAIFCALTCCAIVCATSAGPIPKTCRKRRPVPRPVGLQNLDQKSDQKGTIFVADVFSLRALQAPTDQNSKGSEVGSSGGTGRPEDSTRTPSAKLLKSRGCCIVWNRTARSRVSPFGCHPIIHHNPGKDIPLLSESGLELTLVRTISRRDFA